jgi:hypothetical protein
MDVDKFAKKQLDEVIAITEKATTYINNYPELKL